MTEAIISLGSNMGDRKLNLTSAINALGIVPGVGIIESSNLYETIPFGVPDEQSNYLNCCVKVSVELSAHALLGVCLGIEAAMGRERKFRFSSRIIDIDLLLYADHTYNTKELAIPHPRIRERAFVIVPMGDLCKDKSFYNFDFSFEFNTLSRAGINLISRRV